MKAFFFILCLFVVGLLNAQTSDSSALQHSADTVADKNILQNIASANISVIDNPQKIIEKNLIAEAMRNAGLRNYQTKIFFPKWFNGASAAGNILLHPQSNSGDYVFFMLIGMMLFLGITKIIFPQYFSQLFQFLLYLRDYKKMGLNDSSAARIVSSLLLNILFFITASWCLVWIVIRDFSFVRRWQYWVYTAVALSCVYLVKYSVVFFSGWLFEAKKEASIYNYVVFSINKIAGILLVPVIILIVYCVPQLASALRFILISFSFLLLIYRYIASFILIRENLEVNIFHFFLYLCAVEIMPLLLVYKLLLLNWGKII